MDSDWGRQPDEATIDGKILISGVGFVVTGGMWALLGFFQQGDTGIVVLDSALVILHIVVGALILRRQRFAWYAGITLVLAAMLATIPNDYYLPLFGNGVTGILLAFSRDSFNATRTAKHPDT